MVNTNIQRQLVGGDTSSNIGQEIESIRTKGQAPVLQRAVVIEVIADPYSLTEEEKNNIASTVNNDELVSVMPPNSIVGIIVSNQGGNIAKSNTILFPFFSSHMQLPVKVGETVYVIYEDFSDTGAKSGYWFTRVSAQGTVEDVNYSHHDRKFDPTMNPDNYSTSDKLLSNLDVDGPGFPNGGNTPQSLTLSRESDENSKQDPFKQIKAQSRTDKLTTNEPVPRFKKRPGDHVIQGSNNTLISLGEDRTGPLESPNDIKGQSGTIDLVVGRGRKLAPPDAAPINTSARVVKNINNELETDKAPHRKGKDRKDNLREGDPDLINDAARLYVSMQTNGDKNFNLSLNPKDSLSLPELPGPSKTSSYNKSYAIGKADHVRMIARKDNDEGVSGTVLLIREGQPDEDLGYFFIDEAGQIQIESKKIYIGKATDERNPMICYENYQDTITALQNQIDFLAKTIDSAFKGAIGNLGIPILSLQTLGAADGLANGTTTVGGTKVLENTKPEKHSNKIFVENTVYPK